MDDHSPSNDLALDSSRGEPDAADGQEDENVKRARSMLSSMTSLQLRLVVFVIQNMMNSVSNVAKRRQNLLESINETLRMSSHYAIDAISFVTRAVNGEEDDEDDEDEEDDDDDDDGTKHLQNDDDVGNVAGDEEDEDNDNDEDDEIEIDEEDDEDVDDETNNASIPVGQKGGDGGFEDDDDDDDDVDVDRDLDVIDGTHGDDDDDDDEIDIEVQEEPVHAGVGDDEDDEDNDAQHTVAEVAPQDLDDDDDDDEDVMEEVGEEDDEDEDELEADRTTGQGQTVENPHLGVGNDEIDHDDDEVELDLDNIADVGVMEAGTGNGANLDSNLNVVDGVGESVGVIDDLGDNEATDEQADAGNRKRRRSVFDGGEQPQVRQVRRHS